MDKPSKHQGIASELTDYLTNLGIDSRLEGTQVLVNKTDFDEELFSHRWTHGI